MNTHDGVNQASVVALWFAFSITPLTLTPQDGDETCTIFPLLFFPRSFIPILYFLLCISMFY